MSYWDKTGKYEDLYHALWELVPGSGSVREPKKNPALEKLRKASNCYYDLFNNGLCNRAREFYHVFGFSGKEIVRTRFRKGTHDMDLLEYRMDEIVLNAAKEQGFPH